MAQKKPLKVLTEPLFDDNPIARQILGICSALAVTTKLDASVVMALSVIFVTGSSGLIIGALREYIPNKIRIIFYMTVISSLVIVVDQVLQAFLPDIADQLSVFVGLIITNCIVMGRAEAFAQKSPPLLSFLDGIGNGLGYGLILVFVGFFRELLGSGQLWGHEVLWSSTWYERNLFMLAPPSALILIGLFIWLLRTFKPEQIEKE
ncbi:MAG: NADH:ubiquinone reductase (Na(+)-transporting) subunit D [Planctomycetota bacterium]|nr:MAG: NADH:ubiquinone reductase (Na(+)-transporting) subunit D [Planctomycetota bacterium]REK24518.1 MAG: NADH:ubiquinone reductase (Na(+)-transporting) subunit D [Planctomycetota bacterium]REK32479.1 MAG: NADH:ubiquinone reductase (Na(+)-transporting) subunit D [Planctomycetota bacterium]